MTPVTTIAARSEEYARELTARIHRWLGSEEAAGYPHGRLLVLAPDLFRLLVRLLVDERVPGAVRPMLVGTLVSVVSPADFLPESLLGTQGLEDDLLIMALVTGRLFDELPAALILESWDGDQALQVALELVLARGEAMVGHTLWSRLRRWVG